MSVVISFPSGRDWFKANWVFRQLCEDLVKRFQDPEMARVLELARAFNHLDLRTMDAQLATRLMSAIGHVAQGTVDGLIPGRRTDDSNGDPMYRKAMAELLAMIEFERE